MLGLELTIAIFFSCKASVRNKKRIQQKKVYKHCITSRRLSITQIGKLSHFLSDCATPNMPKAFSLVILNDEDLPNRVLEGNWLYKKDLKFIGTKANEINVRM